MEINKISNRTIFRILGIATAFLVMIWLVIVLQRQLTWVVIAFFLALALNPAVETLRKVLPKKSRGAAAFITIFGSLGLAAALLIIFAPPLVGQAGKFVNDSPRIVRELQSSQEPYAVILQRYNVQGLVQQNQERILQTAAGFGGPALEILRSTLGSLVAILSIIGLTFFMILEGPAWLKVLSNSRYGIKYRAYEEPIVAMYQAVSGYVAGNLLTSLIAAVITAGVLTLLKVPYAVLLGLMVGIIDLIPLFGATLAATIVLIVCLFQSVTVTVIMLAFFLIYQQLENHLLQPLVYSKTVQISPLVVLVSALLGASLAGIVGALLAIPIAASIKIALQYYLKSTRPTTPKTKS